MAAGHVCVIGSGPAGSSVALRLARRGIGVTVLESGLAFAHQVRQPASGPGDARRRVSWAGQRGNARLDKRDPGPRRGLGAPWLRSVPPRPARGGGDAAREGPGAVGRAHGRRQEPHLPAPGEPAARDLARHLTACRAHERPGPFPRGARRVGHLPGCNARRRRDAAAHGPAGAPAPTSWCTPPRNDWHSRDSVVCCMRSAFRCWPSTRRTASANGDTTFGRSTYRSAS